MWGSRTHRRRESLMAREVVAIRCNRAPAVPTIRHEVYAARPTQAIASSVIGDAKSVSVSTTTSRIALRGTNNSFLSHLNSSSSDISNFDPFPTAPASSSTPQQRYQQQKEKKLPVPSIAFTLTRQMLRCPIML